MYSEQLSIPLTNELDTKIQKILNTPEIVACLRFHFDDPYYGARLLSVFILPILANHMSPAQMNSIRSQDGVEMVEMFFCIVCCSEGEQKT